jgi:hypothetical protein
MENMFRSAERRLGIDDPLLGEELAQELSEAFWSREFLERAVELELVLEEELLEFIRELAAEDATEDTDRQEKMWRSGNPPGAIHREATGRHDAVHMGMMRNLRLGCQLNPGNGRPRRRQW